MFLPRAVFLRPVEQLPQLIVVDHAAGAIGRLIKGAAVHRHCRFPVEHQQHLPAAPGPHLGDKHADQSFLCKPGNLTIK